jgi:hypothetical protein
VPGIGQCPYSLNCGRLSSKARSEHKNSAPILKTFEVNYRIKALADSGQKRLASGGKTIALAGAPPASRIVLSAVKNIEEAQAIDDRDGKEVRQSRQSFRTSSTAWHPGVAALAVLTEARRGGG